MYSEVEETHCSKKFSSHRCLSVFWGALGFFRCFENRNVHSFVARASISQRCFRFCIFPSHFVGVMRFDIPPIRSVQQFFGRASKIPRCSKFFGGASKIPRCFDILAHRAPVKTTGQITGPNQSIRSHTQPKSSFHGCTRTVKGALCLPYYASTPHNHILCKKDCIEESSKQTRKHEPHNESFRQPVHAHLARCGTG